MTTNNLIPGLFVEENVVSVWARSQMVVDGLTGRWDSSGSRIITWIGGSDSFLIIACRSQSALIISEELVGWVLL